MLSQTRRFNEADFESNPPLEQLGFSSENGPIETRSVPVLTTPLSLYDKRIRYSVLEYTPLLDSANMDISHWVKIATDIELNYSRYDAFVIVHGTDTMAYTASALSFMLEDLGKTVVITGSQVPLSEWRTDAEQNLLGALLIAGHFVIPEVCIFFSNKLIRGNRSIKVIIRAIIMKTHVSLIMFQVDALDFVAFESPNMKPLATMGVDIDVSWKDIRRPQSISRFGAHKQMNSNVATLRIFPSIAASTVEAFLREPIQGVVLETYGAGNAPTNRTDLLKLFKTACDRGVVIVNITQCKRGHVSDLYATGKALAKIGIVPGADMTGLCALTKLSYLLGKGRSPEDVRQLMMMNLRGELTLLPGPNIFKSYLDDAGTRAQTAFIHSIINLMGAQTEREKRIIHSALLPHLVCATAGLNDVESFDQLQQSSGIDILINTPDFDGRTALHIAAAAGHKEMVERLLKVGASVHLRDNQNQTALALACRNGHSQVASLLFKSGAHFDPSDLDVVLHFIKAVASGDLARVKTYTENGLDVSNINFCGQTPLAVARQADHTTIADYLHTLMKQ